MDYNSNKSKGYEPLSSGPNMTGYYLGESPNLMGMQTGGSFGKPKTRGAALLARALQKQDDLGLLEDYQRAEAERQKKGGLFGSIASTAGGLLGAAIGGPAGAAIGAGLGKGFGEKLGAGKAEDYDASGTVFSQQSFRDVDEASEEFNEGMLGRSLLSGAVAGATAGLTPGGGIYGQYNPLTSTGQQGIKAGLQGLGVTGYTPTQSLTSFGRAQYEGGTGGVPGTGNLTLLDKARRYLFGGRSLYNLEDGGYIGYDTGGVIENPTGGTGGAGLAPIEAKSTRIENLLGFDLTPEQLALLETQNLSPIQNLASNLQSEVMGVTEGDGLASVKGTGFGVRQSTMQDSLGAAQQSYEDLIQSEEEKYTSEQAGVLAGMVSEGAEIRIADSVPKQPPTSPPTSSIPNRSWFKKGADGRMYMWSAERSEWVTG